MVYEILVSEADPFDLMCDDCDVHYIEYYTPITEEELREEHLYMLGADASIPDWQRDIMKEEFEWTPTDPDFDKWLEQSIAEGYIRRQEVQA